ncbi:MAG: class II fructose-bisphosphate aldolase [Enterobacter hormaechei]
MVLTPTILRDSQEYVSETQPAAQQPELRLHGGSGSSAQEIKDSVSYGVVKMNIDTDTQWATWDVSCNIQNQRSLPARSAGQPERRRPAEQEILRSTRMAARCPDFYDYSSGAGIQRTERG